MANNSQHCRMLQLRPFVHPVAHSICTPCCTLHLHTLLHTPFVHPVAHSICTLCCTLLCVIGSGYVKFETGQTLSHQLSTRKNIGSVYTALPTLLGPRARQRWLSNSHGVVSFPLCTAGPNIVGSCSIPFHTTKTRTQQLFVLLVQQCWELLPPFARS